MCGSGVPVDFEVPRRVHHADRRIQYASADYVARLEDAGCRISMSAKSNPYDNTRRESFFKTLKREEVYLQQYQRFAETDGEPHPLHRGRL